MSFEHFRLLKGCEIPCQNCAMMIPVYRNIFSGVDTAKQMRTKMTCTYINDTPNYCFFLSIIFYIVLLCELSWCCVTCQRRDFHQINPGVRRWDRFGSDTLWSAPRGEHHVVPGREGTDGEPFGHCQCTQWSWWEVNRNILKQRHEKFGDFGDVSTKINHTKNVCSTPGISAQCTFINMYILCLLYILYI